MKHHPPSEAELDEAFLQPALLMPAAVVRSVGGDRNEPAFDPNSAIAMQFDEANRRFVFSYESGMEIGIPVALVPELAPLTNAVLKTAYLTPSGEGLTIEEADVDICVHGMLARHVPLSIARSAVASANGKVRSQAKSQAARENGKKGGGRPPKDRPS